MAKDGTLILDAWVETMRLMPDASARAEMAKAIMDYAYDGTPYTGGNKVVAMMIVGIVKDIDRRRAMSAQNRINGRHGGNPAIQGSETAKSVNRPLNRTRGSVVVDEPLLLTMPEPEKPKKSESFERAWVAYGRKGSKKAAMTQWYKLTDTDRERAEKHIPHYIKSTERQFLKDFERYLMHRIFDSPVYERGTGTMIYDPSRVDDGNRYNPELGPTLVWNDESRCHMYIGFWNGYIPDGYADDERPDGARVTLNNGRGTVVWSRSDKEWKKQ